MRAPFHLAACAVCARWISEFQVFCQRQAAAGACCLLVRYAAPVMGKPPRISGEAVIETIPKKY